MTEIDQETKDQLIEEVRAGLTPEDTAGEKVLYSISGPGIDMDSVGGCPTWIVSASSTREALFIVFALGTEFFKDLVLAERLSDTLTEDVLDFDDSGCWHVTRAIGNCIYGNTMTKSAKDNS